VIAERILLFVTMTGVAVFASPSSSKDAEAGATTQPAGGKYRVGFHVFKWSYQSQDSSQKQLATAVWYPTAAGKPGRHEYMPDLTGSAIPNAPPASREGPLPLIVYSHGFGGGGIT